MTTTESKLFWLYYGGGKAIVANAIAVFLGAIFLLVGYFVWQTEQEYALNGVAATGIVTRKDHRVEQRPPGQKGGPRTVYTLHYRYQDDHGQAHEGGDNVDLNVWNQLQKEHPVQIEYLRDQPEKYRITAGRSFWARYGYLFAVGAGGLLVAGALGVGIGRWIWAARKARLVFAGDPVLGIVTGRKTAVSGSNRTPPVRVLYQFTDTTGTERPGATCWLLEKQAAAWPEGVPILVLQDPNNPARSEADIFGARSDDLARLTGKPITEEQSPS